MKSLNPRELRVFFKILRQIILAIHFIQYDMKAISLLILRKEKDLINIFVL